MPAPVLRPLTADSQQWSKSAFGKRKRLGVYMRKTTATFAGLFGQNKGLPAQESASDNVEAYYSLPRRSPMPTSIIRSRKPLQGALNTADTSAPVTQAFSRPEVEEAVAEELRSSLEPNDGGSLDNIHEATATFFTHSADTPDGRQDDDDGSPPLTVDGSNYTSETVRDREAQLQILRCCNQTQLRELETVRKLSATYIERRREAKAQCSSWQDRFDKVLTSAGHWRREAAKQTSRNLLLQRELHNAHNHQERCDTELSVLKERCSLLEKDKTLASHALAIAQQQISYVEGQKQACLKALLQLQAEHKALQTEKVNILLSKEEIRLDYEVLVDHKTVEYLTDPTFKAPQCIEPNEVHEIRQTLEQSQRNHETERQLHVEAFELSKIHKADTSHAREESRLLREQIDQLRIENSQRCIVEKHIAALKALFAAGKIATSGSSLAEAIDSLTREIIQDRVSTEMLSKLMQEVSALRETARSTERQHEEETVVLRRDVEKLTDELLSRDSDDLKQTLEIGQAQNEVKAAKEMVVGLTDEREYWRARCASSLQEKERAVFETMENRLRYYKHIAQDQQSQIDAAGWDLVVMRGWAQDELANVSRYLDERDWYKAQVDALEAQFSTELQSSVLQMPFRPAWRSLSEEERATLLQKEEGGEQGNYAGYRAVREAYLNAELSDHEKLAEDVVKDSQTAQERQASPVEWVENVNGHGAQPGSLATWEAAAPPLPGTLRLEEQEQQQRSESPSNGSGDFGQAATARDS